MRASVCCIIAVTFLLVMQLGGVISTNVATAQQSPAKAADARVELLELKAKLPAPKLKGKLSLEEAIKRRRTVRSFADTPLTLEMLSQLLWAAQGITDDVRRFKRAAPSAGATYPIEIFVACGKNSVKRLGAGIWRYIPAEHALTRVRPGDQRAALARHSLRQMWAAEAPVTFVIVCNYARTTGKYRERGVKYVHYEAGNVSQNIFLQCESLGLSAGIIGAFHDDDMSASLGLPKELEPLLSMPIGHRKVQ